ncbi:MAG: hypothetical protein BWK79_13145 [Beggiatoa sp. IS2]|nr:MAG: hypothetical protein BWK79_13145 [Beggiatoa sp. IS2]
MITIFNKLNFSKQHPVLIENFDQLRERLLDWLLVLSVLLMIPSSILMIMRSFSLGWTLNSFLQLIIYGCFMILVWQRRRIPYNWRSYLMIGLWWLSCTIGLFLIGPAGEAKAMFIVLTLITMLLLPVRFGWLMVGLIALTINVVGIMVIWYGWKFTINYQLFINDPLSWLFASYHLSVFAGLSAYVVWQMVHALQISLEQSQAQREQLQTALARQQAIFASNNAAIAVIRNRTFIEVNEYLAHFFGYQTAELVGQPTRLVYLNDEHYETFGQQLYQSLLDHQHYATEFQFRHKNGLPVWTYISVSKLQTTAQGVEVAMLAIDISKRKQMEESLRTAEQFAHATVNALSAHLCVLDEHGTILTVNRAWRKFAQLNPPMSTHYAEGTNYLDICDNAANNDKILEAAMMANGIRAILQGRRENFSIEYACHSPTEQRWFIANVNRFSESGPARVVVTHENITEHKCAEIALKTSEERYRSLITAMSEGVVMQNQQGKIITCNAAAERILGLTQDQMIGRTALDPRWRAIREDGSDFPGEIHPASIALRTGKPQHGVIMGVHKPNSQLSWILINAEPLFQEDKTKPHAVVATFSDITEARIVKLQIEEQRRTLQTVLDNIPVAVQVFAAPSATVILANQQAQKLLGRPVACDAPLDDLNQTYGAFIDGTDTLYPPEKMPLVRGFAGETTMVEDMELRRLDGSRILLQVFGAPIRDDTGQVTASVVIFQDVTERKRAEENIKANEQRLRRLGDNLPSGAIYQVVHTSQGQVYFPYISAGIERIFGVSAQEIIANAWSLYRLIESEANGSRKRTRICSQFATI